MKKTSAAIAFLFVLFFCANNANAQVKDSANVGSARGIVWDSTFNFVLTSATVAVYRDKDTSLLQYSLPNSFGEFSIKSLPTGIVLRMDITHVGYKVLTRKFTVPKSNPEYVFGKINLLRKTDAENELSEIVVTPIRMNGDTLEFNASAFKLDKNATTEDLLRKLPGFTIWGDGEITFNGKKINSVLVDGKPFMGGDFASATQNLPKDALQTVQVYQQVNQNNLYDSTTNVNLKLKEDKKVGYFGKVSGGYGTDKRYAADGMLGGFNKKMQVSVVGAVNNTNKVAGSANRLMESSRFKGEGASIDYQPNFKMGGLNRPIAAGVTFQYDYMPNTDYWNTKRLNGDYFLNNNNTLTLRNTTSNTFLNKDSLLTQLTASSNTSNNTSQSLNARYQKRNSKFNFDATGSVHLNNNESVNESSSQQERTGAGIISTNESKSESKRQSNNYNLGFSFSKQEVDYNRARPRAFTVKYNLGIVDNTGSSNTVTKFRSVLNPASNRDYSRLYDQQDALSINNTVTLEYPSLKRLIFGKKRLGGIDFNIGTTVTLNNNTYNDRVLDYDTSAKQYKLNNYLTNERDLDIVNVQPYLNFTKSFWKHLSNRYSKNLAINAIVKGQHYDMQHRATRVVQNFGRSYNRFVPFVGFYYSNNQYGRFDQSYSLNYNATAGYPQVNHIAPLIDSSNVLYIPKGNVQIRPQYDQTLSFNFGINSQKPKNQYGLDISISVGKTDDRIVDSTFYDGLGRRINYAVNANGFQFVNGSFNLRKSHKLNKNNNIQLGVTGNYNANKTPGYLNGILNRSYNQTASGNFNVNYALRDIVNIRLEQSINFYRSEQKGFSNNEFKNTTIGTGISGALQLPKNLTWSSNITYNSNVANKQTPVNFTLWNASLTYRFLKGNRGEVKCSALDILRQNQSIINSAGPNSQTFGYTNVLQQYYMITLSYYPRKFGR